MKTRVDYPDLYSFRTDNLWKDVKEDDDISSVKVISYFKPRARGESEITGVVYKPPSTSYELVCDVNEVLGWLKKKYTTQRFWKPYEGVIFAQIQHYLDQCLTEGYSRCILSKQEFAILQNKSKGKKK